MDNDEHVGPFNIGNPNEFTMLELANRVKEVVNPDAKIAFQQNTADDPHKRRPDISKAKKLLDWEPTVQLSDGLTQMIDDLCAEPHLVHCQSLLLCRNSASTTFACRFCPAAPKGSMSPSPQRQL